MQSFQILVLQGTALVEIELMFQQGLWELGVMLHPSMLPQVSFSSDSVYINACAKVLLFFNHLNK